MVSKTDKQGLKNGAEAELSEAWSSLIGPIPDRYQRSFMNQLGRYCSARGKEPFGVSDEVLEGFEAWAAADGRLSSRAKQLRRDVTFAWNALSGTQPGWPQITLVLVNRQKNISPKLKQMPQDFIKDVEAYLAHTSGDGLFDSRKRKAMRPKTKKDRQQKIMQLVAIFIRSGGKLSLITRLKDLVQPDVMRLILEAMWQGGKGALNGHHHNRARTLRMIAEFWAYLPPNELQPFKDAEGRFRPRQFGMTDSVRNKLRPFLNDYNCALLINLPYRIIEDLKGHSPSTLDAVQVQLALACAMLPNAPMRIANLASLNINTHIQRISGERCHIIIPADEVKNERNLDYPLGKHVIELLDLYVRVYRPILLKSQFDDGSLFISLNGKKKTEVTLSAQITHFIKTETGFHLNPHAFRHLIGLIFLRKYPGEYEPVKQMLGHKDIKTTIKFYVGLETQDTFKRLDGILTNYSERHAHERQTASL
jgi:integrase